MITPARDRATSFESDDGITAADAHAAAGITYRQLDHWARQGWVRPSINLGEGRWAKRRYAPDDIVRLDLLRHLAMSKVNAAIVGPEIAKLTIPAGEVRVLWGPIGSKESASPVLRIVAEADALGCLEEAGAFVVYNPARVRRRIHQIAPQSAETTNNELPRRRHSA